VEINDANSDMDMGRPDPIPEIDDGQIIQIN
jgi:hypothetical protein